MGAPQPCKSYTENQPTTRATIDLDPACTLRTIATSESSSWDKLAVPVLWHSGQRRVSVHSSAINNMHASCFSFLTKTGRPRGSETGH